METRYYCPDGGSLEGRLFRVSFDAETRFIQLLPGKKKQIQAVAAPSGEKTQQHSEKHTRRPRLVAHVLTLEEATRSWQKYHQRRHGTPTRNGMYSLGYQFGMLVVEEHDLSTGTFIPIDPKQSTNMHNLFLRVAKRTLNYKRGTYSPAEYEQHHRAAYSLQRDLED